MYPPGEKAVGKPSIVPGSTLIVFAVVVFSVDTKQEAQIALPLKEDPNAMFTSDVGSVGSRNVTNAVNGSPTAKLGATCWETEVAIEPMTPLNCSVMGAACADATPANDIIPTRIVTRTTAPLFSMEPAIVTPIRSSRSRTNFAGSQRR